MDSGVGSEGVEWRVKVWRVEWGGRDYNGKGVDR